MNEFTGVRVPLASKDLKKKKKKDIVEIVNDIVEIFLMVSYQDKTCLFSAPKQISASLASNFIFPP